VEYQAKYLIYSKKQHLFLVAYEFSGTTNEVVLYRENTDAEISNSKSSTVKGIIYMSGIHSFCQGLVMHCVL